MSRTPNQTFELYFITTYLDTLHSLRNSLLKRYHNLEVELQPLNPNSKLFKEALKVVADELCENPKLRLSISSTDPSLLQITYQLYISLLEQGYNCCLYDPKQHAIIPSFDSSLIAIRVAHLRYKGGSSDKVYHIYLLFEPNNSNYALLIRYGRRGGAIRAVRKDLGANSDLAYKVWESTYNSKLREGYKVGREFAFQQLSLI